MSDFQPELPPVVQEELLFFHDGEDKGRVRSLIGNVTTLALSLYGTAKERSSAGVRAQIDQIEAKVQPLREPVLAKWKEHAEPLVDMLDNTLEDGIIPQAKAVEEQVSCAVTLVHGKVQQAVVKPYIETKDQIVQYTHRRKNEVVEVACNTAERAIDYVLPDFEGAIKLDPLDKSEQPPQEMLVERLTQRANLVSEVFNELSYKYLPDEESTSLVFSKVIEVLPTPETSEKVAESVLNAAPVTLAPIVSRGFVLAQPAMDFTFDRMLAAVLLTRKLVLSIPRKPVLMIEDKPTTKPTTEAEEMAVISQPLPSVEFSPPPAVASQKRRSKRNGKKPRRQVVVEQE